MPSISLVKSNDFTYNDFIPNPESQTISISTVRDGVVGNVSFSVNGVDVSNTDNGELNSSMFSCGLIGCGIGDVLYLDIQDYLKDDLINIVATCDGQIASSTVYRSESYSSVPHLFDYMDKTNFESKISKEMEVSNWTNINIICNSLATKCNSANGSNIQHIYLLHQNSKPGALSPAEYDSNITKVQNILNEIINASVNQGLNSANDINLFLRSNQGFPLLMWQRDSNFRTIQTAINSISSMYLWAGV